MRFAILLASLVLSFVLLSVISSAAFAAGYSCLSVDRDTLAVVNLESANSIEAKDLVFIDPTLSKRKQTVAFFSSETSQLNSEAVPKGLLFTATVGESIDHPGKRLGGTKIGLIETVTLEVQTVTRHPEMQIVEGVTYAAEVTYTKKDGETLKQDFDCALFLGDHAPEVSIDN